MRKVEVDSEELEGETVTLVDVTTGVEDVAGGRLEAGMKAGVGDSRGVSKGESGVDCSGSGEFPPQTNWQDPWDKALSKLSQT